MTDPKKPLDTETAKAFQKPLETAVAALSKLTDLVIHTEQQSHAAVVITATTMLDFDLERCIIASLSRCSKSLRKRMFTGYGPLATFSAKIDLAYMLGVFGADTYQEIQKIRKMRNIFAHSKELLSFKHEMIIGLFKELKKPTGAKGGYPQVFMACIVDIDDVLEKFLVGKGVTENIRVKNLTATAC
jgi:hypothetical protein